MPLADKMARQWAGIERAIKFANHNPAFRPAVASLVDTYFAVIDSMVAELEPRRERTVNQMTAVRLIAFVVGAVPVTQALSVWSDVGSIQETIKKRKLDASHLGMPGDYHTVYDEARQED
jgi:hypothetical protein